MALFDVCMIRHLRYAVRYPNGYREGHRYPTILFLHGENDRGADWERLAQNELFAAADEKADFPFVVVVPLCHENSWADLWAPLTELVSLLPTRPYCDGSRLYALGVSMGGYGVWQLGMSLPHAFAALVPICGGGMAWNAARLREIPIRAYHGEEDPIVPAAEALHPAEAVNREGGQATVTLYVGVGHEAWTLAYQDPELFPWLLSQKRHGGRT